MESIAKEVQKRRQHSKISNAQSYKMYVGIDRFLMRIPIIRGFLSRIKTGYQFIGEKDVYYLSKKSVFVVLGLLSVYVVALAAFWSMTQNPLYTAIFLFFLWYISESYFDYFIGRSHYRLLEQFIVFMGYVRQGFYEYRTIDDGIYSALEQMEIHQREMTVQAEHIYEIFSDVDPLYAMTRYFEIAPNPYLKMFVNLSHLTYEYGDQHEDGKSVYLTNLSFLTKNVQLELIKRKKLNYALKSMNIIAIIPLFLITMLKNWAIGNFAPLGLFYNSMAGKYIEILTIAIMFLAMIILNRIQRLDDFFPEANQMKRWIAKIQLPLSEQQKRKWLYGIIATGISFLIVISILISERQNLSTQIYYQDHFLGATLPVEIQHKRRQESLRDYAFIQKSDGKASDATVDDWISSTLEEEEQLSVEQLAERRQHIQEKIIAYNNIYFAWWQIILCLMVGVVGYHLPQINEKMVKYIKRMEVEDEIAGYYSIILMLMYHPRMNTEEICDWMAAYSTYYKETLSRCQLDMSMGAYKIFMTMREGVEHPEMKKIMYQLAIASEDISIQEAFDELVQDKSYYIERRQWLNDQIINRKIVIGQNIGFLPAYSLIILYMIIPMIMSSISELEKFFYQLMG